MPYLTAAHVGAVPTGCVAVEDSPNGVPSADAAGCAVLAVPCEVDILSAQRVTIVPSLVEVDLGYLRVCCGEVRLVGWMRSFVGDGGEDVESAARMAGMTAAMTPTTAASSR